MNIRLPRRKSLALAAILLHFWLNHAAAVATPLPLPHEFRIGYQKSSTLHIVKLRGDLEKRLGPMGVAVKWAEFPFGPPMLEALNAARLDYAITGETPPVLAQAVKGSQLVYVAQEPASPQSEAIVVPSTSRIQALIDLKGKKVAVAKGSNAHYLLIRILETVGLSLKDIQPVYLAPADARAAFERGAVDAWSIWDFHLAAAEMQLGARALADGRGTVNNFENYLSRRPFAERYPELLAIVLQELAAIDTWVRENPDAAAAMLSEQTGLRQEILVTALKRHPYGASPVTVELLANQQKIADTLYSVGLIPLAPAVREATLEPTP